MNNRLYVGGIPFAATNQDLANHFSMAGNVLSAMIILDRENGNRSKGFGFVEMDTAEAAQKAIELFHDKEMMGRRLTVNIAKPREERAANDSHYDRRDSREGRERRAA